MRARSLGGGGLQRGEKPPFNTARGAADTTLLFLPPFSFPGVTARVFPLRASINLLRSFCVRYLNVAPPEVCEFYPYLPYVFLVVLDYGRMAIEASNLGWVSQHEIFFAVPLGKWRLDRAASRPVLKSWVVSTPFIFVDNPTSLTGGRESYGWPKVLAELHPSVEQWLTDPRNPNRLLTLDVKGFGSDPTESTRLLEIDQQPGQNFSLVPPDLDAFDPFVRLFRLSRASMSIGADLAQLFLRSPLSGYAADPGSSLMVLLESIRQILGVARKPGLEAVTLKQFRDSADPAEICYQAIVQSWLSATRYNRGGLLGVSKVLQGDITGGFRIRLHDHPVLPIVESLGLEVARERSSDGRAVSTLEPFFPFWLNVDLFYSRGRTLCWRMRREPWRRGETRIGPTPAKTPFNTVAGAAQQVWQGPFFTSAASFYVFPLPAEKAKLVDFVNQYLNTRDSSGRHRFELCGRHVYMVARESRMFSEVRSAAWIESHQISFYIPLLWYHEGKHKLVLVTPFAFVDNPTLAMTMREVQGVPAMDATIEAPSRLWRRKAPLLTMRLNVFSTLDAGLGGERRMLLEVGRGDPPARHACSRCPSVDHLPTAGDAMALQRLTLKQFRDAEDPERACFQALIQEPWTLSKPRRVRPLKPCVVKIYRYPSLPLVD